MMCIRIFVLKFFKAYAPHHARLRFKILLTGELHTYMRITKKQLAVITFLNVVIAALLCYIFLVPWVETTFFAQSDKNGGDNSQTVDTPPEPEKHEKLRAASVGKVPAVVRETRLMGNGDESVVSAFFIDGVTYVFGNATVAGLDFDGYGGFLCMADEKGAITNFTYYAGRMTAAALTESGFAVATLADAGTEKAQAHLYVTGLDGKNIDDTVVPYEVIDIFPLGASGAAAVFRPDEHSFMLAEYALSSADGEGGWRQGKSTYISSGYTLEYFDCYVTGEGYTIAARAHSLPRYDSLVFFSFEAGGDATTRFYGGSGDSAMRPYAVMPCPQGYLALCRREGGAAVVTVDYTFMKYKRDLLGFAFDSAELYCRGDSYYACFACADGPVTYVINGTLDREIFSAADGMYVCGTASGAQNTPVIFGRNAHLFKAVTGGDAISLDVEGVRFHGGVATDDGMLAVISATGGAALSTPTGRDVYIVVIKK